MPIYSSGISSCRRHGNADIFVGPFISSANKETIFREKCQYFIRTWENSSVNEEIIYKKMPIASSGMIFYRYYKIVDIFVGSFIFSANKETIFREKCRYFIRTWQYLSVNEEIILKKMPIVSSGMIFCRHYEIADFFVRAIHFIGKQRNHFLWNMPIFRQNLTTFVSK